MMLLGTQGCCTQWATDFRFALLPARLAQGRRGHSRGAGNAAGARPVGAAGALLPGVVLQRQRRAGLGGAGEAGMWSIALASKGQTSDIQLHAKLRAIGFLLLAFCGS